MSSLNVRPLHTPIMQARYGTTRANGGIWIQLRPRQLARSTQPTHHDRSPV